MKILCDLCDFTTKSEDMLKRHMSAKHKVKNPVGRKKLANKKSRKEINWDYR